MSSSNGVSMGQRLLRSMGYRSRLGMAFVPIGGGGAVAVENDDDEALLAKHAHEARWLASRRLRAIRLPSLLGTTTTSTMTSTTSTAILLVIPPPKTDVHGIGYDPFRDAPEFREHRERRLASARERGRGGGGGGGGVGRGDRYFTNDLKDGRRRAPWEREGHNDHDGRGGDDDNNDDDEDDASDVAGAGGQRSHSHSQHHAADRDYTDFVGTKASSGFALDDDDDANAYQDDDDGRGGGGRGGGDYATEIHSPAASEDEGNGIDGDDDRGLFGGGSREIGSDEARKEVAREVKKRGRNASRDDGAGGRIAPASDAWSAWGIAGAGATSAARTTAMDGRPPLSGFSLGRRRVDTCAGGADPGTGSDAPGRGGGPMPPAGYVLKRHVFEVVAAATGGDDDEGAFGARATEDGADCGLGLNLQRRREQRPSRSFVPKVLPSAADDNERRHRPEASGKLLARDGKELNFHAVRESMKNRFVASSAGATDAPDAGAPPPPTVDDDDDDVVPGIRDLDEEEFVDVAETAWVPTRLLCKRWGVPVPSMVGGGSDQRLSRQEGRGGQGKEEDYFRRTVYEPAVADRRRDGDNTTKTKTTTKNGGEVNASASDGGATTGALDDESDDAGPPPMRPSTEVFRSIFDAESDMDISSSDDDVDAPETEGRDGSTMTQTKEEGGGSATPERNGEIDNADDSRPPDPIDSSSSCQSASSSSSSSTTIRRKRHRRHRHSSRDDSEYDEGRRMREGTRHSEGRRRRQRDYSSQSDGEESGGSYGSEDSRKRTNKKKKKKKHRSRSRH